MIVYHEHDGDSCELINYFIIFARIVHMQKYSKGIMKYNSPGFACNLQVCWCFNEASYSKQHSSFPYSSVVCGPDTFKRCVCFLFYNISRLRYLNFLNYTFALCCQFDLIKTFGHTLKLR